MRQPIIINNKHIFPIALGTWGIGTKALWHSDGSVSYSPSDTDLGKVFENIIYSVKSGINYIDTCLKYYGKSPVSDVLKKVIHTFDRNNLFINAKLDSWHKSSDDIRRELDTYLRYMDIDFVDMYQIHHPMLFLSHQEAIRTINRLIDEKLVRGFGVSNFNVEQLQETIYTTQYPLLCCEIHYNLLIRVNERDGIIDFCNKQNLYLLVYQPLRRGEIAKSNYPLLKQIANKHNKTQNQILINWLCNKRGFIPIIKSTNIDHIKENLEALSFELSEDEIKLLDNFRAKEFADIEYDYWSTREDKKKRWKL